MKHSISRREFHKSAARAGGAAVAGGFFLSDMQEAVAQTPGERPVVGCIGMSSRGKQLLKNRLTQYADVAAICDVDSAHAAQGKNIANSLIPTARQKQIDTYEDYRKLLQRKDIDAVVIATVDHWHVQIAMEAMLAGKDVYCEKPLTLTIEEGQRLGKLYKKLDRVFQVGTQQRSDMNFLKSIAIVHEGRIGKVKKVTIAIGTAPTGQPLPVVPPSKTLNWDFWQGPVAEAPYREGKTKGWAGFRDGRAHGNYRWWYEYSGGKPTDWGAHHVDIAQWAIEQNGPGQGPISIEPLQVVHPNPLKDGMPTDPSRYNVMTEFHIKLTFPDGIEMHLRNDAADMGFGNGIMLEGTKGRIFVKRGKLAGKPVEDLAHNPLPAGAISRLYRGENPTHHMRNFFNCMRTRKTPISDPLTHHQMLTTCHLSAIAARLGRKIEWDARNEKVVGDEQAQSFLARERRKGFELPT